MCVGIHIISEFVIITTSRRKVKKFQTNSNKYFISCKCISKFTSKCSMSNVLNFIGVFLRKRKLGKV